MTVHEAIKHCEEKAKEKYVEGMLCHANPDDGLLDGCIQCAKEHEQLAEWLKELERYRAMGTVEELKETRGKQDAKPAVYYDNCGNKCASARCPRCFEIVSNNYCGNCGQRIE